VPTDPTASPAHRPPYAWAGAFTTVVLALYVATLAPTTQFWDTSEYMAAAKVLGIPHQPGNPLFVLLANAWGRLPLGDYAYRINLFSAACSALASGLLFLVAERLLRAVLPAPDHLRRWVAAAGVFTGATAFTVWNQSVVNEKVYTLSLLSIALVLWLVVHWADQPEGERRDHWLLVIVYLIALSTTNHLMGALVAPAVAVYVLMTDPRVLLRPRMWIAAFVATAVGLSLNGVLPIRAAHYPPINEGEPVTWEALRAVLAREQYQKGPLLPRQADILWQYGNYFQYFGWQFAHDWSTALRAVTGFLFGGLGLLGGVALFKGDRRGGWATAALMVTVTLLLVFYLDFKYGYSFAPSAEVLREVRERDYFFVASFQLWSVWTALGLGVLLQGVRAFVRGADESTGLRAGLATVLVLALVPLVGNRQTASRAGEWLARDSAWDILQSVEPHGILVTAGDNDTFPLWYMQEVEGVRRDVTVANLSLARTLWHPRQIKRREPVPYTDSRAIALYDDREWPAPTDPLLQFSIEELDAIPQLIQVPRDRNVLRLGNIRVALTQAYLDRADVVIVQLLRDNLGKRPIYFSRTVGAYADELGLAPYLLGQGLVRKLVTDSLGPSDNVVGFPLLGWVDVERTERLLFEEYHVARVARSRPRGWPDPPSSGILSLYGLLYRAYADYTLGRAPDSLRTARAAQAAQWADAMFVQTGLLEP
jgi:hypothetical protein